MPEERERITNSFKLSPSTLGYIISAVLGALGGGTIGTAIQQPAAAPAFDAKQFVTRQEFDLTARDLEKRLGRIEQKLDALTEAQGRVRR